MILILRDRVFLVCLMLTTVFVIGLNPQALAQYTAQPFKAVEKNIAGIADLPEKEEVILLGRLIKTESFPINLKTVLKLVNEQNLRIAQNRMGAKVEKSRFYQNLAGFLPDCKGTYEQRRFQGVVQLFGNQTLSIRQTVIQPGMSLTHRLYPGGKRVFDTLASRRRVNASQSLVKESYQQQLSRAVEDYYSLLGAQYLQDFATKSLAEARAQVAIDEARFKAGVGTRLEVMLSKTAAAKRRRELIDANNGIAKAEQVLLNRLNLDVTIGLIADKADATQHRLIKKSVASDRLITQALKKHPALERLKNELKSMRWESRSVLSEALPSVDLNAAMSYRGPRFNQLGLNRSGGFSVQTTLGDNLGFSLPTRWLEKHRLVKQKRLEQEAQIRDIESATINAYLDSQSFEEAIEAANEEKASAEESFRLSMGRYKAGVGIQLDLLTAESALSQARAAWVQSVIDFNKAQIQLLESIGEISEETLVTGFNDFTSAKEKKGVKEKGVSHEKK